MFPVTTTSIMTDLKMKRLSKLNLATTPCRAMTMTNWYFMTLATKKWSNIGPAKYPPKKFGSINLMIQRWPRLAFCLVMNFLECYTM
jgi:hypothetical protein